MSEYVDTDMNITDVSPAYPGYVLSAGSRGSNVSVMQSYLNAIRLQLYPAMNRLSVDGIYGSGTKTAVMQYQAFRKLKPDGIIGETTWNSIVNDYSTLPVPPADRYPGYALKPGTEGAAVLAMQTKLNLISPVYTAVNKQTADGKYGKNMENAVRRFQGQFGLVADGIIGEKTWDKITAVHSGVMNNNNTQVESRYPGYVLNTGSRGDSTRFVQSYINAVNISRNYKWPVLTVDGIYGQMTKENVRKFQAQYGLSADGITGRKTWAFLINRFNQIL